VGRTDVWDHRQKGAPYSLNDFSFDKPRLPVGTFHFSTLGSPLRSSSSLHLYNASCVGSLVTSLGSVMWTSIAHAQVDEFPVVAIDISVSGNEQVEFWFEPAPATSPRNASKHNPRYVGNPPAYSSQVFSQPFFCFVVP
jgi:hypothetical protein